LRKIDTCRAARKLFAQFSFGWAAKSGSARDLLGSAAMHELKPLHQEAELLLRAVAELRPDQLRSQLAVCDYELAALRSETSALDGPARHRLSFMVTTLALCLLSAAGIVVFCLGAML
jgi:hypothetical protein